MPASKRKRRGALRLVPFPDNSAALLALLSELTDRAMTGELIALGTVEVERGGDIAVHDVGADSGHAHSLVAGCVYLERHLMGEE